MTLEDELTQKEEFENMLHKAIERYRSVLEELAEL
jgi:hypothetical protein